MKFDPPSLLPVEITLEIDTKLSSAPIKINLIIEDGTNLLKLAIINLNPTNTSGKINHLAPQFHQILPSLLNLKYRQFPLSDQHNDGNG